jgi:UDP-N-acetylglucosamine:LPS N-acetylglucosamine transferase
LTRPLVVALRMGYGHLRPAHALAERLGVAVLDCDHPPLADEAEARLWRRSRELYEGLTRLSTRRLGGPLATVVESLTRIAPLHPVRDRSAPDAVARGLDWLGRRGLGAGTIRAMKGSGAPMIATHFAPALLADRAGCEGVYLLVTDSDLHRAWVAVAPERSHITYLAPSPRALRRLASYGVPAGRVVFTGFPLPDVLTGGDGRPLAALTMQARVARLDRQGRFRQALASQGISWASEAGGPPRLTFAVGGAGGQVELAEQLIRELRDELAAGRLVLALVAGVRDEVRARLATAAAGLDLEILYDPDHASYFRRFNELIARTDVLWTKPSELAFFAALGLPIIAAPPVGAHEAENLAWLVEHGAALAQPPLGELAGRLADWLDDGVLAGCAWNGLLRLPGDGTGNIVRAISGGSAG